MKKDFYKLFKVPKPVIGMVHIPALPGTPRNKLKVRNILKHSVKEAIKLKEGGVDAVLIENMHDLPYLKREVGSEIASIISVIGHEIKQTTQIPCGVQILGGANLSALSVALAGDLDFLRCEGFVYAHIADEGYMESDAGTLLRKRKFLDADHILVLADIKKKHGSHFLTSDVSLKETIQTAEFFGADGVIVTGSFTGRSPDQSQLKDIPNQISLPLVIGSGLTPQNLHSFFHLADGFIVGSYFKEKGSWENNVDPDRVRLFIKRMEELKGTLDH